MRSQHFSANRWLIFAPVAILALFAPTANAEPVQGLQTTYYTIDSVPPTRSDNIYTECGSEVEININRSYDGEPYLNCTNDLFMVHMTGFITIPEHQTIEFWLASDDGGTINIGGNEWGNWSDQGCSWMESGQIDISAGSHALDLWMYENGGNTCVMLAWNINNQGWSIVPDEAFLTTVGIPTDTTLPIITTTVEETTTTLWESTTTSTIQQTSTSTIAPSTTVTATSEPTTTTLQTTTTEAATTTLPVEVETTTTSEALPVETTLPTTQSTEVEASPSTVSPTTTVQKAPATTSPDTTVTPDTLPEPSTSLPNATETSTTVNLPSTTFPEDAPLLPTLSDTEFVAVLQDLQDALPDQITAIVTTLLNTEVTSEQAVEVVSSSEVLESISGEQAQELFDAVDQSALTVEQQIDIVAAVQQAPTAVKEAFENEINIFGGEGFDDYVPVGSNVNVAVRRTIIVGTTILVAMPSPVVRRNS